MSTHDLCVITCQHDTAGRAARHRPGGWREGVPVEDAPWRAFTIAGETPARPPARCRRYAL